MAVLKKLKAELALAEKLAANPPPKPKTPEPVCPIKETPAEMLAMIDAQKVKVWEVQQAGADQATFEKERDRLLDLYEMYQLVLAYQPEEPWLPPLKADKNMWGGMVPREFTAEELDDSRSATGEVYPDRMPGGAWVLRSPMEGSPLDLKSKSLPGSRSPSNQGQESRNKQAQWKLEKSTSLQEEVPPEPKKEVTDKTQNNQGNQVPLDPTSTSAQAAAKSVPAAANSVQAAAKSAGAKTSGKSKKKRK